jgi:hypothetical protein
VKKKNRGDDPIWVIIQIYMEMSQGNSMYNYLTQIKISLSGGRGYNQSFFNSNLLLSL